MRSGTDYNIDAALANSAALEERNYYGGRQLEEAVHRFPVRDNSRPLTDSYSLAMDAVAVVPAAARMAEVLVDTQGIVDGYQEYAQDSSGEIPYGKDAGYLRNLALKLSTLLLAFGWVAFFKSVRQLATTPKAQRHLDLWLNAGLNFIAAAGMTIVTAFIFTGLAYVAPYIIAAILGLNALQGLFYAGVNLYRAWNTRNAEKRWQYLVEAGKQIVFGIVLNSLAMVLNIFVFQTANLIANALKEYASDFFSIIMHFEELMNAVNTATANANKIKPVASAWAILVAIKAMIGLSEVYRETKAAFLMGTPKPLRYEMTAWQDMKWILGMIMDKDQPFWKRALLALTSPATLSLYALTATVHFAFVRPLSMLVIGVPTELYNLGAKLFSRRKHAKADVSEIVLGTISFDLGMSATLQPQPQPRAQAGVTDQSAYTYPARNEELQYLSNAQPTQFAPAAQQQGMRAASMPAPIPEQEISRYSRCALVGMV